MAQAPKRKRVTIICQSCEESENFDDMVNCGKCHKWTHFCCAGVGSKIKYEDWQCTRCKAAELATVQDEVKNLKIGHDEIKKVCDEIKENLNVDDVKAAVSELSKELNEVKQTIMKTAESTPLHSYSHSMPLPTNRTVTLPCMSLEELQDLLIYVKSDEGFLQFKSHISALCGSDVPKSVRNILFDVMDKDVQKLLSWSGFRTTKPSFEKQYKKIVDAISETLNEKFADYSYMFKKKVSVLLNNAGY